MNSRVIAAALSLGLTTAAASQWASHTQLAQGNSGAAGINLQGIGLTTSHKQIIYDKIPSERPFPIGQLDTMPNEVKDQIGLLKDFKYVRLQNDKILIVDPATREIMDIITKQESDDKIWTPLPCDTHAASPNVRFGSLADILRCGSDVRFAPESGHVGALAMSAKCQ